MYVCEKNKDHRSSAQQFKNTDTGYFHSSNHQKWLPNQLLGGKTAKIVQIDPQSWTSTSVQTMQKIIAFHGFIDNCKSKRENWILPTIPILKYKIIFQKEKCSRFLYELLFLKFLFSSWEGFEDIEIYFLDVYSLVNSKALSYTAVNGNLNGV